MSWGSKGVKPLCWGSGTAGPHILSLGSRGSAPGLGSGAKKIKTGPHILSLGPRGSAPSLGSGAKKIKTGPHILSLGSRGSAPGLGSGDRRSPESNFFSLPSGEGRGGVVIVGTACPRPP